MNFLSFSPAPYQLGDSSLDVSALRVSPADAVFAVLIALVLLPLHGLLLQADRTSLRAILDKARQAEPTWSITPDVRTFYSRVALYRQARTRLATHFLRFRRTQPPESPGGLIALRTNETRDFDQREPAGDPGRHHRGRPAR